MRPVSRGYVWDAQEADPRYALEGLWTWFRQEISRGSDTEGKDCKYISEDTVTQCHNWIWWTL